MLLAAAALVALALPGAQAGFVIDAILDPLILGAQALALWQAARRSARAPERRFWRLLAFGALMWLVSDTLQVALPSAWVRSTGNDIMLLLFYLAAVLACESQPQETLEREEAGLRLQAVSSIAFTVSLLVYFVLVPRSLDPEAYETLVPSLLLFVLLDAFVAQRFAYLRWLATDARWRSVYGLLALAFLAAGLYDLRDLLRLLQGVSAVRGGLAELLFYPPMVFTVLAARLGGGEETPTANQASAPLALYAVLLPLVHVVAQRVAPMDKDARAMRELVVIAHVVILGGMAAAQQVAGERRSRRLGRDLRAAEKALQQARRMEALGRLAGGVAHDFNNMLAVMMGYADLLLRRPLAARERGYAEQIRIAGARAAALTGQLLAFSRRQPVQGRAVDLDASIGGLLEMIRRLAGDTIKVVFTPGAAGRCGRCDPAQLSQILLNLTANARDAMPEGGTLALRTGVRLSGGPPRSDAESGQGYVELEVEDSGVGMSLEAREHLFEPFFTTKATGTGLGLATVYGIVRQHGGAIEVDSAPNRGTRVTILLPSVMPEARAPGPPLPAAGSGSPSVLLVEDEAALRELAQEALEAAGFRVLAAPDGAAALALAASRESLDLLLTDLIMPGLNGRELAERLWARWPGLPVVFTSGYPGDVLERHGLSEAESVLLAKPYKLDELVGRAWQLARGRAATPR